MSSVSATVTSQPITATASGGVVNAAVSSSPAMVTIAGGVGPQGPAGVSNVPGPAGATGPQGPAGVAGARGEVGATGAQGVAGVAGPQGIPGVPGAAGVKGDTGERGPAGPSGPAGEAGAQGIQGVAGATGPAGAKGDRGDVGPAGATGAQGPQGVAGATGSVGPAGATGATGPQASLVYASINDFPATGSSTALYLDESTSRLYQWESPVYVEVGTSGGGIATTSASDLTSGTLADARLSSTVTSALTNARTPTSHASSHASGGSDALTLAASQITGLPTAGTGSTNYCAGNDARLSDSRSPTGAAGGDLTGTYPNPTIAPGAVVTADIADAAVTDAKIASVAATKLTGTIADARLSSNIPTWATIATSQYQPSSTLDIYPRGEASSTGISQGSGTIFFVYFTPSVSFTMSAITMVSGTTAAAGLTLARMGIYTMDETTATLVARTASDTTLFTTASTAYTRSLSTAGGFPASYTCNAGLRYAVAVICVGTTAPLYAGRLMSAGISGLTPRVNSSLASQTDLVASTTTFSGAQGQPWARLT